MAGGRGERLYPLTKEKAKPAVTFGGIYKVIDFTLSNCINSGIRRIHLLTQYSNASLDKHIHSGWNLFHHELGEFIDNIPPQKMNIDWWYRGTADSIYQNLNILERERPDHVLVLSGDHIYKMDYQAMLDFHLAKGADLTAACMELDIEKCRQMGVMEINDASRIIGFEEKPAHPTPLPANPAKALSSMGIYIFKTDVLVREIVYDAKRDTQHDFGRNIIPHMLTKRKVFAYNLQEEEKGIDTYWRDVGSLESYYEANMELLEQNPVFNLYDDEWPIRTYHEQAPPAKFIFSGNEYGVQSEFIVDCLIPNGCVIFGGRVRRSILSPFVTVQRNSEVDDSILLKGVTIGSNVRIRRAIIDEDVTVPDDYTIGYDLEEDEKRFTVTKSGIVVIPQGSIID